MRSLGAGGVPPTNAAVALTITAVGLVTVGLGVVPGKVLGGHRMRTKRELLVRLILLAAVSAIQLLAQGDRGEITGTVTDATGAVVPGARITAIQTSTYASYKTTTSTAGDFTVPSLPVGTYQVKVEAQGFKTHVTDNVAMPPGATARIDVKLEVDRKST